MIPVLLEKARVRSICSRAWEVAHVRSSSLPKDTIKAWEHMLGEERADPSPSSAGRVSSL